MTYLSTVLADTPLHYWRATERSGQLIHDIGASPLHMNGNWFEMGYSGIATDGGGSLVSSNTGLWTGSTVLLAVPLTVEFWFWLTYDNLSTQRLFAHDGTAGSQFFISLNSGRTITCGAGPASFTSAPLTAQTWHHIVMAAGGLQGFVYIDGVSNTMSGAPGSSSATKSVNWGALVASSSQGVNGVFTEMALYSSQLTPARVAAHFAAVEFVGAPQYLNVGGAGGPPAFSDDHANILAILAGVRKTFPTT